MKYVAKTVIYVKFHHLLLVRFSNLDSCLPLPEVTQKSSAIDHTFTHFEVTETEAAGDQSCRLALTMYSSVQTRKVNPHPCSVEVEHRVPRTGREQ